MGWDSGCYHRFREERAQPFYDLCALLEPAPGLRVVDLGCGTGELTAELHRRLGASETIEVALDKAMLARAPARGEVCWGRDDLTTFVRRPEHLGAFDEVFSSAALH